MKAKKGLLVMKERHIKYTLLKAILEGKAGRCWNELPSKSFKHRKYLVYQRGRNLDLSYSHPPPTKYSSNRKHISNLFDFLHSPFSQIPSHKDIEDVASVLGNLTKICRWYKKGRMTLRFMLCSNLICHLSKVWYHIYQLWVDIIK